MQVNVADPVYQTILFSILLTLAILITLKKDLSPNDLSVARTNELKGLATLLVVFSHIGYFLVTDTRFLYPLSIMAGVGVNLFLILSGFGLTISSMKSHLTVKDFYLKRLSKIYTPMWFVITILIGLDLLILGRTYPVTEILGSFIGFFPRADIFTNLNSPLWYFSFILFYYVAFPLVFSKKRPLISMLLLTILGYVLTIFVPSFVITKMQLPINPDVLTLYKLHFLGFPLGMGLAVFLTKNVSYRILSKLSNGLRYLIIPILIAVVCYTAIHSGIGAGVWNEQLTSLVTASCLIGVILLKKVQSSFIIWLGIYSYEIYLIQWPLLYRFDFLYKYLPAYLATFLYLFVFTGFGYIIHRLVQSLSKKSG